jgi:hypothetical protein
MTPWAPLLLCAVGVAYVALLCLLLLGALVWVVSGGPLS